MNTQNVNISKSSAILEIVRMWGLTEEMKLRGVELICKGAQPIKVLHAMREICNGMGALYALEITTK